MRNCEQKGAQKQHDGFITRCHVEQNKVRMTSAVAAEGGFDSMIGGKTCRS